MIIETNAVDNSINLLLFKYWTKRHEKYIVNRLRAKLQLQYRQIETDALHSYTKKKKCFNKITFHIVPRTHVHCSITIVKRLITPFNTHIE